MSRERERELPLVCARARKLNRGMKLLRLNCYGLMLLCAERCQWDRVIDFPAPIYIKLFILFAPRLSPFYIHFPAHFDRTTRVKILSIIIIIIISLFLVTARKRGGT